MLDKQCGAGVLFEQSPILATNLNLLLGVSLTVSSFFLEICAGSAVLYFRINSISAQKVQVIPIDFGGNKHQPKTPITKLDLTQPNHNFLAYSVWTSDSSPLCSAVRNLFKGVINLHSRRPETLEV